MSDDQPEPESLFDTEDLEMMRLSAERAACTDQRARLIYHKGMFAAESGDPRMGREVVNSCVTFLRDVSMLLPQEFLVGCRTALLLHEPLETPTERQKRLAEIAFPLCESVLGAFIEFQQLVHEAEVRAVEAGGSL